MTTSPRASLLEGQPKKKRGGEFSKTGFRAQEEEEVPVEGGRGWLTTTPVKDSMKGRRG